MILEILSTLILSMVLIGIVYRRMSGRCTSKVRMDGKTVIITGASAGIGKAAAMDIAKRGAKVIMACRNLTKAERIAEQIRNECGNSEVRVEQLDTSDLDSVRRFAQKIKETEKEIHVLLNNAGTTIPEKQLSPQGLELTMATNHYGPFLLTNLLLDVIKKTPSSRIVNVSSIGHTFVKTFDCDDLNYKNMPYYAWVAYCQSKLCNVLFTKELARKLEGTGVTVNCLHPGVVATEILHKEGTLTGYFFAFMFYFGGKDIHGGAQTSIYLSVSEEVEGISGKYFVDCKETKCSKRANDSGLAKKLWEVSEKHVNLKPTEIFY